MLDVLSGSGDELRRSLASAPGPAAHPGHDPLAARADPPRDRRGGAPGREAARGAGPRARGGARAGGKRRGVPAGLPAPARARARVPAGSAAAGDPLAARGREVGLGRDRARDPARDRASASSTRWATRTCGSRRRCRSRRRESASSRACRRPRPSRARHCSVSTRRPRTSAARPRPRSRWGAWRGRWPMGAQLIGRIGQDAVVLAVSRQLEEALPWSVAPAL